LAVGEIVKLSTVVGKGVYAVVRRRKKTMYGFEFLKLSSFVQKQIQKLCEGLRLFKSLDDG
jgi:hypothetical protein